MTPGSAVPDHEDDPSDEPAGDPAAAVTDPVTAPEAAPEAGPDPVTEPVPAADDGADDGAEIVDVTPGRSSPSSATTRRGLVLAGVLVLGLVIGRVTAPGDGESDGEASTPVEESGGLPFPAGDMDRANYWGLAGLVPVVRDTFERADAGTLGETDTGQVWETVDGTWGTTDRSATVQGSGGQGPTLAVAADPDASGAGLVEVTVSAIQPGSGLVFRYLDRDNHWTVTARPGIGVWAITRVVEGRSELVREFEGSMEDGTTLTVIQNEATMRFLLDGEDQISLTDATLSQEANGGLVATNASVGATRWDQFMVMGFNTPDQ